MNLSETLVLAKGPLKHWALCISELHGALGGLVYTQFLHEGLLNSSQPLRHEKQAGTYSIIIQLSKKN